MIMSVSTYLACRGEGGLRDQMKKAGVKFGLIQGPKAPACKNAPLNHHLKAQEMQLLKDFIVLTTE